MAATGEQVGGGPQAFKFLLEPISAPAMFYVRHGGELGRERCGALSSEQFATATAYGDYVRTAGKRLLLAAALVAATAALATTATFPGFIFRTG